MLRLLWGGDAAGVSFQGEFFSLTAACSFPKPHDGRILPVHGIHPLGTDRHDGGGQVSAVVRLHYTPCTVSVQVDDDGTGTGAGTGTGTWPSGPGLGLAGMRERVSALGGRLQAGPRDGGGFRVRAELPVRAPS